MSEKQQIENGFAYDRLVWEASDYFARSWQVENDKPLARLIADTRGFLEKHYEIPLKPKSLLFDTADKEVLALDEKEMNYLRQRMDFSENNAEKEIDPKIWRLSNVVRKEIHDCFGIWLTIFKPDEKLHMSLPELKDQAERMKAADPFMIYHALHRQRRERIRVEANWVDKRDSVNLIIDPVAATESQGKILSVTSNEWDQPYPAEMELYAGLNKGLVNLFSLNNYTIVHFDENATKVERKLAALGFVPDHDGVFIKGTLRIRLKNEGRKLTASSVHVNEKGMNPILEERFDLVLRATDIINASSYGLVAAEMRNGLRNSQMLPDFVGLLSAIEDEIPFALSHKLGAVDLALRHRPANYVREDADQADITE